MDFYPMGAVSGTGFARAMKWLHVVEGYHSDDGDDLGGETTWGITEALARRYGYTGAMRSMRKSFAERVYREEFWDDMRLDEVAKYCYPFAHEAFEATVNQGNILLGGKVGRRGIYYLQQGLNAARRYGRRTPRYGVLELDGRCGARTIEAVRIVSGDAEAVVFVYDVCNSLQLARYVEVTLAREVNGKYIRGWYKNRVQYGTGGIEKILQ